MQKKSVDEFEDYSTRKIYQHPKIHVLAKNVIYLKAFI
jgi:hypothetical protein